MEFGGENRFHRPLKMFVSHKKKEKRALCDTVVIYLLLCYARKRFSLFILISALGVGGTDASSRECTAWI